MAKPFSIKGNSIIWLLVMIATYAQAQIPTNGLIGGWIFSGNANDISGNGNNGTVMSAVLTTDRFGAPNAAYNFNGSTSYIVMNSAGPTGSVSRSVSFWARPTGTNLAVGFGYGDASSNGGIFQVNFNYNCQGIGFDNSVAAVIRSGTVINNTQWHHIVAVLDATVGIQVGSVKLYVDGTLQTNLNCSVGSITSTIFTNSVFPITVGKTANASARYFYGDLDDFYFYNRAVTPAEVIQLYNFAPCAGPPPAPQSGMSSFLHCAGDIATYTVPAVTGATSYSWSVPSSWSSPGTSNSYTSIVSPYNGTIGISSVNTCGQSTLTAINITVFPSPSVGLNVANPTVCTGYSTLTATGASGYTWTTGAIGSSVSLVLPQSTLVGISASSSLGCTAYSVFNVGNPNALQMSILSSPPSCPGETVYLSANGAATYTWMPGNLSTFMISATPSVATVFTIMGTSANGCQGSITFTQQVFPSPTLALNPTSVNVCSGMTTTLNVSGAATYTWFPGNVASASVTMAPVATVNYTVKGTDGNGCTSTEQVIVNIKPAPVITVTSGVNELCIGNFVSLAANGAISYVWAPGSMTGFLVVVNPSVTTEYTVSGVGGNGCVGLSTFLQTVSKCTAESENKDTSWISIFPNPSVSEVIVTSLFPIDWIQVLDINGRPCLFSGGGSKIVLDVSFIPSGFYVVKCQSAGRITTTRLLKK
jgi:hypothetical protein